MHNRIEAAKRQFLENQKNTFESNVIALIEAQAEPIELAIITALPLEFKAIDQILGNGIEANLPVRLKSLTIRKYQISGTNGPKDILVGLCPKMGNNASAVISTAILVLYPSVKHIVMCGIAGGIPSLFRTSEFPPKDVERHIRLGDVVLGTKGIYQYDMVTKTGQGDKSRATPSPVCAISSSCAGLLCENQESLQDRIKEYLAMLETKDKVWCEPDKSTDIIYDFDIIDSSVVSSERKLEHPQAQPGRREGFPLAHLGQIGSANILLKNPALRQDLWNLGIAAIEMEASGVADATWSFGVGVIAVRGICDYCDFRKGDMWQHRAAAVAAATTVILIQEM